MRASRSASADWVAALAGNGSDIRIAVTGDKPVYTALVAATLLLGGCGLAWVLCALPDLDLINLDQSSTKGS